VGGLVLHDTNSHSLTPCTRNDSSIFINHKNGVGASVVYKKCDGKVKKFNSVYDDILMRRLAANQKIKEQYKQGFLRRIHVEDMKKDSCLHWLQHSVVY
jgi:hypothetical protein